MLYIYYRKISNRKLYRLALGMVVSMGFFLAYLVYSDVYRTGIHGTKYRHLGIDPGLKNGYSAHGRPAQSMYDQRNLMRAKIIHQNIDSIPGSDDSKRTLKVSNIHHAQHSTASNIDLLTSSKKYPLEQQSIKLYNVTSNVLPMSLSHKPILPPPNVKNFVSPKGVVGLPSVHVNNNKNSAMNLNKPKDDGKLYLIYLCHSFTWCGGWGDRQRGITSTYFLSRIVNRQFKIIMTTPCGLNKFYSPHKTNWLSDSHTYSNASFVINDIYSKSDFRSQISNGDFNKLFPQKVVYIKTNHDYHSVLLKNPHYMDAVKKHKKTMTKRGRFRWAWEDLMQPSEYLLRRLQNVVGTDILIRKGLLPRNYVDPPPVAIGKKKIFNSPKSSTLICAHVRMGRNPTIPMDEYFDSIKPDDIPKLIQFLHSKDKIGDAMFFVATDFGGVRIQFQKFFGNKLIDYGGKILHIDRQRGDRNACVGFEVALLDQLILSICDVLVVSRSGFSIHASHVSNSTERPYIMENGVISHLKV